MKTHWATKLQEASNLDASVTHYHLTEGLEIVAAQVIHLFNCIYLTRNDAFPNLLFAEASITSAFSTKNSKKLEATGLIRVLNDRVLKKEKLLKLKKYMKDWKQALDLHKLLQSGRMYWL